MKRWQWIAIAVGTLISIAVQFLPAEDAHWWDRIPGFWAMFGFLGCLLIIFVSKAVGKYLLQRKEDYYDES